MKNIIKLIITIKKRLATVFVLIKKTCFKNNDQRKKVSKRE